MYACRFVSVGMYWPSLSLSVSLRTARRWRRRCRAAARRQTCPCATTRSRYPARPPPDGPPWLSPPAHQHTQAMPAVRKENGATDAMRTRLQRVRRCEHHGRRPRHVAPVRGHVYWSSRGHVCCGHVPRVKAESCSVPTMASAATTARARVEVLARQLVPAPAAAVATALAPEAALEPGPDRDGYLYTVATDVVSCVCPVRSCFCALVSASVCVQRCTMSVRGHVCVCARVHASLCGLVVVSGTLCPPVLIVRALTS
jgi:hypothetical protein